VGRDEAEVEDRLTAQLAIFGSSADAGEAWLDARRDRWVLGTPEQALARIAEYRSSGAERLLFQIFLPRDLEHVALLGELAGRSPSA
jgi:alkanesulfonate monooxygenase SsuD/methylene tetrahydromethanopterin reductase-like flavin-dependent oxidoreductase (luciferase family)